MDYQLLSDQITSEADGVIEVSQTEEESGIISGLFNEGKADNDFDAIIELNRDGRSEITDGASALSAIEQEYGVNTDELSVLEIERREHRNVPFVKVYVNFN